MNIKSLLLCSFCISLVLCSACGKDDEPQTKINTESIRSNLKLDVNDLVLSVGEETSIKIIEGAGDYKVFSENTDILTASIEESIITITSKTRGRAGVVVSDKQGNYKRVPIVSRFTQILTSTETLSMKLKLGASEGTTYVLSITSGNGGYKALSSAPDKVRVDYIDGDNIGLVPVGIGESTVTITDELGINKEITVVVELSTEMYNETELERLKTYETDRAYWGESNLSYYMHSGNPRWTKEGDVQKFTFTRESNYSGNVGLDIQFEGDFTVGKKKGILVKGRLPYRGEITLDSPNVEIIKVTDNRVWIVFSQVKDNEVLGGHLIYTLPDMN